MLEIPDWKAKILGLPVYGSLTIHEIANLVKELPQETGVLLLIEAKRHWSKSAVDQYADARRVLVPSEHPSGLSRMELEMRRMERY